MKRKILAVAAGFMMLAMTGCGNDDMIVLTPNGDAVIRDDGKSSTSASGQNKKEETKQTETMTSGESSTGENNAAGSSDALIHVGFAQVGSESGWRLAQTQSMKQTFTEANGYQFDFVDCNNDQKTQLDTLQQFIDNGVEYIVLDPIVEDGYDDVLKKAKEAGIPVIVVDRNINADESLYTCWVGSDFAKEGQDAAKWLIEELKEKGRDTEDINILTILGSNGASATTGRTNGFEEAAKEQPHWKLLDKQSGDFNRDGGNAVMKAYLKQYDDIDVLVCQNDDEAFGAIEAIKDAGKTCGPNGDIIIISFDATKDGFQAMIDGDINVDVECNPLEGPFVSELIQKLHGGESVDKIQYMEEGVFPAEEAEATLPSRAY